MSTIPADYNRKYRAPAVYVLLLRNRKLAAIKREHTGWMDGKYAVPSGHVETEETYLEAAIRETREEVGVVLDPENVKFVHFSERDRKNERVWDDTFFICGDWKGELTNMEPKKHSSFEWLDYNNLPYDEFIPYIASGIRNIKQGIYYSVYHN